MTLINHTYGFIFIHVPKNAGTSVAQHLSALSTYRDLEIGATALGEAMAPSYRERYGLHKHSTLAEIREVMGQESLARYRTLAVVREPEDRIRSIYQFLRTWPEWSSLDPAYADFAGDFATDKDRISTVARARALYAKLTGRSRRAGAVASLPDQDLVEAFEGIDDFIDSALFMLSGPDRLFVPQSTWLTLDGASVAVDHVIRFEHLERDLERVIGELGLPADRLGVTLSHVNTSRRQRDTPLRSASIARLRERYALDYRLLGPWA